MFWAHSNILVHPVVVSVPYLTKLIYLFIYLITFTMITILKKTREKNTFEQDIKTKDEGAGHTTERGSKLSVPLRKIHKY